MNIWVAPVDRRGMALLRRLTRRLRRWRARRNLRRFEALGYIEADGLDQAEAAR